MPRILSCLLFFISLQVLALQGTDPTRITETFDNVSLKEALNTLKTNYGLKVAFSEKLVEDILVTVRLQNLPIHEAFDKLLTNTAVTFEYVTPDIVIIKRRPEDEAGMRFLGQVVDAQSGEQLPFAYLLVKPTNQVITSNVDGFFTVQAPRQPLEIYVHSLGYEDTVVSVSEDFYGQRLFVQMNVQSQALDAVEVVDFNTRDFEMREQISTIQVNPRMVDQVPKNGEPDVMRMMQLLPGISATDELSSGLYVNGGTATQNLVTLDGFTIYHVDHFFGYFSALNPLAIKSLTLFKGGFDAKYGGRSSSILEATGKDGNTKKVSGTLLFNQLSVNTSLEVPLSNDATIFFAARRSYTDIFSTSLFEEIFDLYETSFTENGEQLLIRDLDRTFEPEFYYSDLNFKTSFKVGAKNQVSLSFYDSHDLLNYDEDYTGEIGDTITITSADVVGQISWGNVGSSIKWSTLWNDSHYSHFLLSYSHYESTFEELEVSEYAYRSGATERDDNNVEQDNFIEDISLKVDHDWHLGNNLLQTGLSASIYNTAVRNVLNNDPLTDKEQQGIFLVTHYVQNVWEREQSKRLTLGLRSNYLSSMGKFLFEPRASFSYPVSPKVNVIGSSGIYRQFVNQVNSVNALVGSRDIWVVADDEVPDQRAIHGNLGFNYIIGGDYLFSANGFYKDFDGLLDYAFRRSSQLTEFEDYEDQFFEGEGRARGLDLLLKKNTGKLTGWVGYTLSDVRYQFPEINRGQSYYADHDQRHELNIYANWQLGKLSLFGTWFYGSGTPYTNEEQIAPFQNEKPREDVYRIEVPEKNNMRFAPYHRLDMGASYLLSWGDVDFNLSCTLFNIYDRRNEYDIRLDPVGPKQGAPPGPGSPPPGGPRRRVPNQTYTFVRLMGFTPTFSLRVDF